LTSRNYSAHLTDHVKASKKPLSTTPRTEKTRFHIPPRQLTLTHSSYLTLRGPQYPLKGTRPWSPLHHKTQHAATSIQQSTARTFPSFTPSCSTTRLYRPAAALSTTPCIAAATESIWIRTATRPAKCRRVERCCWRCGWHAAVWRLHKRSNCPDGVPNRKSGAGWWTGVCGEKREYRIVRYCFIFCDASPSTPSPLLYRKTIHSLTAPTVQPLRQRQRTEALL